MRFFSFATIVWVAFFLFAPVWAQDAAVSKVRLSLEECLHMASQNNAKLGARGYGIEGARWRYQETKARFWPVLEYTDRLAPVPKDAANAAEAFFSGDVALFNSARIGVGVPLLAFGQLGKAQALGQKGIEVAHGEKEKEETKIHSEIKQLYYGILLSKDLQALLQDAAGKIENQLVKDEESHEHSPYDLLKLKVFKSELERRIEETKAKEQVARYALKIQIGLPEEQSFELADSHLEVDPQPLKPIGEYVDIALEERPDVDLIDLGYQMKKLEYELENRKVFPRLGLGGFFEIGRTTSEIRNLRATDDFNNPFNFTRAGIGLELKGVFDFHGSRARIKRLENEYHKVTLERAVAKEGIALDVKEAYEEAKRLKSNLVRAEEREKMARQMMFLSKTNIDIGVGEEQQYADALQLVLLTRGEYLKAVFDYNIALAKLGEKIGKRGSSE